MNGKLKAIMLLLIAVMIGGTRLFAIDWYQVDIYAHDSGPFGNQPHIMAMGEMGFAIGNTWAPWTSHQWSSWSANWYPTFPAPLPNVHRIPYSLGFLDTSELIPVWRGGRPDEEMIPAYTVNRENEGGDPAYKGKFIVSCYGDVDIQSLCGNDVFRSLGYHSLVTTQIDITEKQHPPVGSYMGEWYFAPDADDTYPGISISKGGSWSTWKSLAVYAKPWWQDSSYFYPSETESIRITKTENGSGSAEVYMYSPYYWDNGGWAPLGALGYLGQWVSYSDLVSMGADPSSIRIEGIDSSSQQRDITLKVERKTYDSGRGKDVICSDEVVLTIY